MTTVTTRTAGRESPAGHLRETDFRHRAACRSADPESFFPAETTGRRYEARVLTAKAVCDGCPVRSECLNWALAELPDGIAGGMTPDERRTERARRARARRRAATRTSTSKGEDAAGATAASSRISHNTALQGARAAEGHRG